MPGHLCPCVRIHPRRSGIAVGLHFHGGPTSGGAESEGKKEPVFSDEHFCGLTFLVLGIFCYRTMLNALPTAGLDVPADLWMVSFGSTIA